MRRRPTPLAAPALLLAAPLLALALVGCAPPAFKELGKGVPTAELLLAANTSRTAPSARLCRTQSGHPQRLPNPEFALHIAARLAGDSLVPAYSTSFHLYEPPTPWALPAEQDCVGAAAAD